MNKKHIKIQASELTVSQVREIARILIDLRKSNKQLAELHQAVIETRYSRNVIFQINQYINAQEGK